MANITDLIIDEAIMLFSLNGYAATTIGEICARAKTTKPALYYRFDGKLELYKAAYLRACQVAAASGFLDHVDPGITVGQTLKLIRLKASRTPLLVPSLKLLLSEFLFPQLNNYIGEDARYQRMCSHLRSCLKQLFPRMSDADIHSISLTLSDLARAHGEMPGTGCGDNHMHSEA